jgi:hypothetical protein
MNLLLTGAGTITGLVIGRLRAPAVTSPGATLVYQEDVSFSLSAF